MFHEKNMSERMLSRALERDIRHVDSLLEAIGRP